MMVDAHVSLPNVMSIIFKDYEAAYLAGIAAASETQTNNIGFIGGTDSAAINAFEQGFVSGINEVNADIEIQTAYLDWFDDTNGASEAAAEMYHNGADIVFHTAGQAGIGVFDPARNIIMDNPDSEIWVIGSDIDQTSEGQFSVGDQEYSITLTSTIKNVGTMIQDVAQQIYDGDFEAGVYKYGMKEAAVDIAKGQLSGDTFDLIAEYREQMQSGVLDISEHLNPES